MPDVPPAIADAALTVLSAAAPYRRGESAAGLPQRIRILQWGENIGRTTKKLIIVGEKTRACLSANQQATASERVPLDYEHQSVPGHPNFIPDPREVAGHGEIELVPGDGVYLTAIDYTPSGRDHAENYQDVSAVAYLDAQNNLLFVRSVALTQHGDVAGMEFSEAVAACARLTAPLTPASLTSTPPTMDPADKNAPDYRAMLVTLLKLKPTEGETEVSDEAIGAALSAVADKADGKPDDAPAGDKPPETPASQATASAPAPAATPAAEKPADVVSLGARVERLEKQRLIDAATAAGKVVPLNAQAIEAVDAATLSSIIDGLPDGEVPTTPGKAGEKPAPQAVSLSAEEKNAATALGLTPEEFAASRTA